MMLTQGCPNGCEYCYEPKKEFKVFDIPDTPLNTNLIQILDMNFLAHPNHMGILDYFGTVKCKKELVCGIDYRRLTPQKAEMLHKAKFTKIRWAWDYNFSQQKTHQNVWKMLTKAGYKSEDLSVFMIVNWKIPFPECMKKLDLLKIWNVKVNDCCWDGGYALAKPTYWTLNQIKFFRKICRKHNQMVRFKIDPDFTEFEKEYSSISNSETELKLI